MSNKTNDERLIIVKERLTEIKQQKDPLSSLKRSKEEIVVEPKIQPTSKREHKSLYWLKYVAIIIVIGYSSFYIYQNMDTEILNSEKNDIKEKPELIKEPFKYNTNIKGHNIIISTEFKDETSANIMKEKLIEKGFKASYFFLPEKSNSKEEIYKILIGPYENQEEKNQWAKTIKMDFEILAP